MNRQDKEVFTANYLFTMSKKTKKSIITNKNQNSHMICFPIYWFRKWKNRYVAIKIKDDAIFIYSVIKENKTHMLMKIGSTHYIKLDNEILANLNYPTEMQLEFFDTYLVLTVTEQEKINIRSRMVEIELRKKNELMKQKYARMI